MLKRLFTFIYLFTLITSIFLLYSCSNDDTTPVEDTQSGRDIVINDTSFDVLSDARPTDAIIDAISDTEYTDIDTDSGLCNLNCGKNMHCENEKCVCDKGFEDCNGDLSDGCEVDLRIDVKNCGVCGLNCGDNSYCENKECKCNNGFANCNLAVSDGCEQNIATDVNNCGGCGVKCGVNAYCSNGSCICTNGYADCNKIQSDGCETYVKDNIHKCGGCDIDCLKLDNIGNVICENNACVILNCKSGYSDCDGNFINGCETNLLNDPLHCGSCVVSCKDNNECKLGRCECKDGYADCNNNTGDGCEINIKTNNNHCGGCNNKCNQNSYCNNGVCTCFDGYADCNNNIEDGCEAFLKEDNSNCGKCKQDCGYGAYCYNGDCVACDTDYANCNYKSNDKCEGYLLSNQHCGQCNKSCNQNAYCENKSCKCETGYWNCNNDWSDGCEVDLLNDKDNCGSCGFKCNFMAYCSNANCTCDINYGNCNGSWEDGCEINLLTNNEHCGACKNECVNNSYCSNGSCKCNYGFGDCNNNINDGCEVNLMTDKLNCGLCGNRCSLSDRYYGTCTNFQCNGKFIWANTFGGDLDDLPTYVLTDLYGNIYLGGTFNSSKINFGGIDLIKENFTESFIVKFDKEGNHIWSKKLGGNLIAFNRFSNGDILIAGTFTDTIKIENNQLTSSGGYDIYIARYSSDGSFLGVTKFGGNRDDFINDVFINENQEYFITGKFYSDKLNFGGIDLVSNTNGAMFIAKFDNLGQHKWSMSYDNSSGIKIVSKSANNIYITGEFENYLNLGCQNLISNGLKDVFIAKLDNSGFCIFSKSFGGMNNDMPTSLDIDISGDLILIGDYYSPTIDFGNNIKLTNLGGSDIFLLKFVGDGSLVWAKELGTDLSDISSDVKVDSGKNIIITGAYGNNIDFGGGIHSFYGGLDAFMLKLDDSANFIFSKSFGGLEYELGKSISIDVNDDIVITGKYSSASITIDEKLLKNSSNSMNTNEIFVAKFKK